MKEDFQPKRLVSYLIIFGIAFIFMVQWGPGAKGCETGGRNAVTAAAYVNGKEIPMREFKRVYATNLQRFNMPESSLRQWLPKQVLDEMINQELLAQAAERQGISPSDEELRDVIHKNPAFQEDGKFSMLRYQEGTQNYYGRSYHEFEAELRRNLAVEKLRKMVQSGAVLSDDEVKARYIKDGNKAALTFVRFLPTMFAAKVPAPADAEVAAFKKDHAKDISEYYDANRFLYQQPERVRARHILIKADKNAPADKKDEAKKRIEELRKQIEGGKDFAAVAKEASEDVGSKVNGGDLGFNERGTWVPAFGDAAFSLKPGEMSQPVETQFGYHLIKVEEKKAAEKKELKDVENDIAKQLVLREKSKALAQAEAEKALAAAKAGKKLAELFPADKSQPAAQRFETETKPEAIDTGEFASSGDSIPQLGPASELTKDVFAAKEPKLLEKTYPAGEGFVIAQVTERKTASEQDFTAQKDKLRADAQAAKSVELYEAYLKALKKAGKVETNQKALSGDLQAEPS